MVPDPSGILVCGKNKPCYCKVQGFVFEGNRKSKRENRPLISGIDFGLSILDFF
jgi:hypothetical protein